MSNHGDHRRHPLMCRSTDQAMLTSPDRHRPLGTELSRRRSRVRVPALPSLFKPFLDARRPERVPGPSLRSEFVRFSLGPPSAAGCLQGSARNCIGCLCDSQRPPADALSARQTEKRALHSVGGYAYACGYAEPLYPHLSELSDRSRRACLGGAENRNCGGSCVMPKPCCLGRAGEAAFGSSVEPQVPRIPELGTPTERHNIT